LKLTKYNPGNIKFFCDFDYIVTDYCVIKEGVYFRGINTLGRFLYVTQPKQMVLMLRIQRDSSEDIMEFKKKPTNALDCTIVILLRS